MKRVAWGAGLAALCLFAGSAAAQVTLNWHDTGGAAIDVGAGGNAVWIIANDGAVYQRHPTAGWVRNSGISNGMRVDVDSSGNPLVVTRDEKLMRWDGSSWSEMPGGIFDVAASAKGNHLWAVGGGNAGNNNRNIFRWENGAWVAKDGGAVRVDVDSQGTAWVVNAQNQIFRWWNGRFAHVPGGARDIAVGEDDVVWIAGTDGTPWRFDGQAQWIRASGSGLTSVSADARGMWGVAGQRAMRGALTGKMLALAAGEGWVRAEKLASLGEIPGAQLVRWKPQHWVFGPQGTLRLEEDEAYCLTQRNGGVNSQRMLDTFKCDGSSSDVGWSYQPYDRTIRWSGAPTGCMAVSDTVPFRGRIRFADPCPDDPQRARWVLRD